MTDSNTKVVGTLTNPYTPRFGRIPPVLAGRDEALRKINEVIEMTAAGRSAEIILRGPPGYGKTTLLRWTAERLEGDPRIEAVMVDPLEVRTGGRLRCLMADRPTFLLVDDADSLTQDALDEIMSLSHTAITEGVVFGFILAGSPRLMLHLFELHAHDLERSWGKIQTDLLDSASVRTALVQPLEDAGHQIHLDQAEVDSLVAKTHCYPYYIQCLGYALWNVAETSGRKVVDSEVVDSAKPEWRRLTNAMLADRVCKLKELGLLPFAGAVARAFSDVRSRGWLDIDYEDIDRVILECDADAHTRQVRKGLEILGYIRRTKRNALFSEPGIPLLMDYVLDTPAFEGEFEARRGIAQP